MIEDKELGLKVAEDQEEAFWYRLKQKIEQELIETKATIELNNVMLPFILKKLKGKNGSKM